MTSTATEGGEAATETQQAGEVAGGEQAQETATTGQQAEQTTADSDELTAEEEAALGDPGKRAVQRMKEGRDQARQEHATVTAELETARTELADAKRQLAEGADKTQAKAVETLTTERDAAAQQLRQVTAALRNGVVVPKQGEDPAAFAERVGKVATMLQGADDAALDEHAKLVLSTFGQPAAPPPPRIPHGDAAAAPQGGGQAGALSMSDLIRQKAGRKVGG